MWTGFARILLWVYLGVGALFSIAMGFSAGGASRLASGSSGEGFLIGFLVALLVFLVVCFTLCSFGMKLEQADNVAKMTDDLRELKETVNNVELALRSSKPAGAGRIGDFSHPAQRLMGRPDDDWVCSKCGRKNTPRAGYCADCGTKRMI